KFISFFEQGRINIKSTSMHNMFNFYNYEINHFDEELLRIFNDRASSRVADTASVIARDIVLWYFFDKFLVSESIEVNQNIEQIEKIKWILSTSLFPDDPSFIISTLVESASWGVKI